MDIKELLKKYSVFILGLYFLAVGIVLIVRSALGTTPISSVNYVLSLNTPLSLGTWTFIVRQKSSGHDRNTSSDTFFLHILRFH